MYVFSGLLIIYVLHKCDVCNKNNMWLRGAFMETERCVECKKVIENLKKY